MSDMKELGAMCARVKMLQDQKAEVESELSTINGDLDRLTKKEIPELMESLGLRNATFEGLGRVQLAEDLYASTRAGKKEEAMQWLRDCGYDGMISETYNASSLKALFRRMIAAGTEIPEDMFSVTPFTRASLVKA